jgi:hypothetical protein
MNHMIDLYGERDLYTGFKTGFYGAWHNEWSPFPTLGSSLRIHAPD